MKSFLQPTIPMEIRAKPKCREMISKLQRKGEAIQVPLLNYLVRTTNGWKEIFAVQNQDQT